MTPQEIKAKLYDLQGHLCNGKLTIRPDGKRDPGDRDCTGCARIVELRAMLREKEKTPDFFERFLLTDQTRKRSLVAADEQWLNR